jgi:hypothetical protein
MYHNLNRRLTEPVQRIRNAVFNPVDISVNTNGSMRQLFKNTNLADTSLEKALSKYMADVQVRGPDFDKERKTLSHIIERYSSDGLDDDLAELLDPGRTGELIQRSMTSGVRKEKASLIRLGIIKRNFEERGEVVGKAFLRAAADSLTPSELSHPPASYTEAVRVLSTKPSSITEFNKAINSVYSTFSGRDSFVSSVVPSLARARSLKDPRGFVANPITEKGLNKPWAPIDAFNNKNRSVQSTYENLERAQKLDRITGAFEHPDGLGVRLEFRGQDPLFIPFQSNVSLGNNSYLLRTVRDNANEPHELHEWMSNILINRKDITYGQLSREADKFVIWRDKAIGDYELEKEFRNLYGSGLAAAVRSQSSAMTTLPVFPYMKGDDTFYKSYSELTPEQQVSTTLNSLEHGWGAYGSEGGMYSENGVVLQSSKIQAIHPWGLMPGDKQDPTYSAFSKNTTIVSNTPGFYSNDSYEGIAPGERIPESRGYFTGVSSEDKALFSNLPGTLEEFQANRGDIAKRFAAHGAGEDFMQHLEGVYQAGEQGVFKKFGQMGETEFLLSPEYAARSSVNTKGIYEMDDPRVHKGATVSTGDVLGFNNEVPVTADFNGTVNEELFTKQFVGKDGTNKGQLIIESNLPMGGAKFVANGVKGQAFINEFHDSMRNVLNALHLSQGSTDMIPAGTQGFADMGYYQGKADIAMSQSSMVADVWERLASGKDKDLLNGLPLPEFHQYQNGVFTNMVSKLSEDRMRHADEIEKLFKQNEDFLEAVNQRVRQKIAEGGVIHDHVLNMFGRSGSDNLVGWMTRNYMPSQVRAWDHGLLNKAHSQAITFDMYDYAMTHGQFEAVKELQSRARLVGGGDLLKAKAFASNVLSGTPTGGRTVSIEDMFNPLGGEGADISKALSIPEGRAGSVFDPSLEEFKDNYNMDLGHGRIVPVPGNEAYGATSPRFGTDQYQVRDYQRKLQEIYRNRNDSQMVDKLSNELHGIYMDQFASGKGSFARPNSIDPNAITGFGRTVTDTGGDSIVTIGPEMFDTIRDKDIKASLINKEEVLGMLWRQPVSNTKHISVKYDPDMRGGYGIGVSARIQKIFEADADKDPFGISLWSKGSTAYEEAHEELTGQDASKAFDIYEQINGVESTTVKTNLEKFSDYMDKVRHPEAVLRSRTAGNAIGVYSNELTNMLGQMSNNVGLIRDTDRGMRLTSFFHGAIRQLPINARKVSSGYDFSQAMSEIYALNSAVANTRNEDEAYDKFYESLDRITSTFGKPGSENPRADYLHSDLGKDDLRMFIRGRTEEGRVRADLMLGHTKGLMEDIQKRGLDEVLGITQRGKSAAEMGAESLGAFNQATKDAVGTVKNAFKDTFRTFSEKHGKKAIMAAGALAVLGLMSHSQNRAPLNMPIAPRQRPEEVAGIQDHVPGYPVPGEMAANPPRDIVQPSNVNTAIVVPVNRSVNTSIRLRAKDPSDAIERSKVMSAFAGGAHQNINVNVSSDPRIGTLRFRDKMRDMREDNG